MVKSYARNDGSAKAVQRDWQKTFKNKQYPIEKTMLLASQQRSQSLQLCWTLTWKTLPHITMRIILLQNDQYKHWKTNWPCACPTKIIAIGIKWFHSSPLESIRQHTNRPNSLHMRYSFSVLVGLHTTLHPSGNQLIRWLCIQQIRAH